MYITFNDHNIWAFPGDEGDQSATGLYQVPELLGVGECLYIAFDQYKVLFEENYEWVAVDPNVTRYDAQLLRLQMTDTKILDAYVAENTQQPSLWQKVRRKKPAVLDFVEMVEALSLAIKEKGITEFYLYQ